MHGQGGRLRLWNETLVEMWKFDHGFLKAEPHVGEMLERPKDLFPLTDNCNIMNKDLYFSSSNARQGPDSSSAPTASYTIMPMCPCRTADAC